jgi:hypothetical protein
MTRLWAVRDDPVSVADTSYRRRHRAGVGLIVLALVAIASGLAGAAIERYVIVRRLGPFAPLIVAGSPEHAPDPHRITQRLGRDLDLSTEQQGQIEPTIVRRLAEVRGMRAQVRAELLGMIDSTMMEIDSVLTPAQRAKFLEMRRRKGYVDSTGHPIKVPDLNGN